MNHHWSHCGILLPLLFHPYSFYPPFLTSRHYPFRSSFAPLSLTNCECREMIRCPSCQVRYESSGLFSLLLQRWSTVVANVQWWSLIVNKTQKSYVVNTSQRKSTLATTCPKETADISGADNNTSPPPPPSTPPLPHPTSPLFEGTLGHRTQDVIGEVFLFPLFLLSRNIYFFLDIHT